MILTITPNTAIDRTIEVANFRVDDVAKGRVVAFVPAGKGANISRVLSTLGAPSILSGFAGRDDADRYKRSFADSRAQVDLVAVAEPTRFDTTVIDPVQNTVTHIREEGFHIESDDLARLQGKLDEILPSISTVAIAGSLPPGMTPAALMGLIDQCRSHECRVCVDTSGPALAATAEHGCSLIKPNAEELAEICGAPIDSVEAAVAESRKLSKHVEIVLTSLGADGAVCTMATAAWSAQSPIPSNEVVNTVGCGDAFLAGFLFGLDAGQPFDACLRQAVACGAASTLTPSAGSVEPGDVERLARQAQVERHME